MNERTRAKKRERIRRKSIEHSESLSRAERSKKRKVRAEDRKVIIQQRRVSRER